MRANLPSGICTGIIYIRKVARATPIARVTPTYQAGGLVWYHGFVHGTHTLRVVLRAPYAELLSSIDPNNLQLSFNNTIRYISHSTRDSVTDDIVIESEVSYCITLIILSVPPCNDILLHFMEYFFTHLYAYIKIIQKRSTYKTHDTNVRPMILMQDKYLFVSIKNHSSESRLELESRSILAVAYSLSLFFSSMG